MFFKKILDCPVLMRYNIKLYNNGYMCLRYFLTGEIIANNRLKIKRFLSHTAGCFQRISSGTFISVNHTKE